MFRTLLILLAALLTSSAIASAAPCIDANASCTEWVSLGGASRSLVYRTYPLDERNERITRVLIMVHGAGRDADHYFTTALAAAFLGRALDDTIVVSPRFASSDSNCHDTLAPNEISWPCNGDSWRSGGVATNAPQVNAFDFMDTLLKKVARKNLFPNLKVIVVTGHSAGGQYVTRYEMANKIHDIIGVPIQYIVSNPSTYAYLDARRPALDTGNVCVSCPSAKAGAVKPYADERNCTVYDDWPYGLKRRTGYAAAISDEVLKKQLATRPTTYLLGEIDILPLGGFDSSCPAMAQGPTRRARGEAFAKYVNENYGAQHKVSIVSLCGHNARCMYTADPTLPLIFPKP
jgi:pimeloyl-ACP methyl ester carboxylesterase